MRSADHISKNIITTLADTEINHVSGGECEGGTCVYSNEQGTGLYSNEEGTGLYSNEEGTGLVH